MPRPHEFNDTDFMLPYFVCWDTRKNPPNRLAKNEARFDCEKEAIAFFQLKLKRPNLYVWRGVLGMNDEIGIDWMHVEWRGHPALPGVGYPWSDWRRVSFTSIVPTPKV